MCASDGDPTRLEGSPAPTGPIVTEVDGIRPPAQRGHLSGSLAFVSGWLALESLRPRAPGEASGQRGGAWPKRAVPGPSRRRALPDKGRCGPEVGGERTFELMVRVRFEIERGGVREARGEPFEDSKGANIASRMVVSRREWVSRPAPSVASEPGRGPRAP